MDIATKAKPAPKPTDRLMEALATLAALLDRTINEVKTIEGEFQSRTTQSLQKQEEALRAEASQSAELVRQEVHEELTRRFQTEVQTALDSLKADFQAERERLRSEFDAERERLSKELQHASDAASNLQVERSRLVAELQRVKEDSNSELERVRAEMQALTSAASAVPASPPMPQEEITRIEARLAEVTAIIEDPATELSIVIRKNVEKLELEAYLKGLRYAVSGRK